MATRTISEAEGEVIKLVDQSVPVSTLNSDDVKSDLVRNVRVHWLTKGANTTGKLQGSLDGTNFYDLQTLAGGVNVVVQVADEFIRIQLVQTVSAETNVVLVIFQM